jgi:hypothetical protein
MDPVNGYEEAEKERVERFASEGILFRGRDIRRDIQAGGSPLSYVPALIARP